MRSGPVRLVPLALAAAWLGAACTPAATTVPAPTPPPAPAPSAAAPSPDPRIGLRGGLLDAEEAIWNLRVLSKTPPPQEFIGSWNSDLAFTDRYAIQGNFNGFIVWDIANPRQPTVVRPFVCPASQSDVSVYRNLLFVSGEDLGARLDCGAQGVQGAASPERFRGIRIFDITDIRDPQYIANVQTCRGSHTHTVLEHPDDRENVYIYVSGSSAVRPTEELADCIAAPPWEDPASALFRIEVIRVPLADPTQAAIVSSPRIFEDLVAPPTHGLAPADREALERARARGAFVVEVQGQVIVLPDPFIEAQLANVVRARGGTGAPTAADSAALREALPGMIAQMVGEQEAGDGPRPGPTQCHDITVYPAVGLAGGACEGYGLLLDIRDPVNPRRIEAVADSNFAYWHSATFNDNGDKLMFTDEWGGGTQPKCRDTDPEEWGANALFTIENGALRFHSYWKLPAPQTPQENCVAHNGSAIPIPGRDVMVQAWYQGGITVFDWTDPANPYEIAYFDRGPVDPNEMAMGGSWSAYWYNGVIVSSEIARGLDILELTPSAHISRNELDAAKTVHTDYFNAQGQPRFVWPPSFSLARAYLDQLERADGLAATRITAVRQELANAERAAGAARGAALTALATQLESDARSARDAERVRTLAAAVRDLAGQ